MCTLTLVDGALGFETGVAEGMAFAGAAPSRGGEARGPMDPVSFCASVRRLALRAHAAVGRSGGGLSDGEAREILAGISALENELERWGASRADAFRELRGWVHSMRRWVSARGFTAS